MSEDADKMDAAAEKAAEELKTLPKEAVSAMRAWWAKHFLHAGHKRLARALLATEKKAPDAAE